MIDGESNLVFSSSLRTLRRRGAQAFWLLLSTFLLLAVVAASAQTKEEAKDDSQGYKGYERLILRTHADGVYRLSVEIAATPAEQSRGLMFRTRLAKNHGMLFLHDPPQRVVMWMKNTYLPLDLIFFDDEGKVVQIVERTTPLSLVRIRSTQSVAAVLELNAGSARRFSLAKGDQAEHRFFPR